MSSHKTDMESDGSTEHNGTRHAAFNHMPARLRTCEGSPNHELLENQNHVQSCPCAAHGCAGERQKEEETLYSRVQGGVD